MTYKDLKLVKCGLSTWDAPISRRSTSKKESRPI